VDAEPGRFPAVIRETVDFGRSRGAQEYTDALTGIARARERLRRRVSGLSAVVCPTVPIAAPDRDDEETAVSTRFTRLFSALGWPAISIPAGADGEGRPVGIQVAAPPARAAGVIAVAQRLDQLRDRTQHT
jgi:aspartyl-tRNA(Asn)/glutamyl-tRNA(Gln) amidotransferase subunit A